MELNKLGGYTDAITCLKETLREGQKASNVDIQLMLSNVQRSQAIVSELLSEETEEFYSSALTGLLGSLSAHAGILQQKINQLNNAVTAKSHTPVVEQQSMPPEVAPECSSKAADARETCDDTTESRLTTMYTQTIEATIVQSRKLQFEDVVGLFEAKRSLHDSIIMPLQYPHLFSGGRQPWRRILLYGPPGTGKSRLAQSVAAEVTATFYSVSSSDLVSSFVGESEKLVKELFSHACGQRGQAVIFIDEIDSLCLLRNCNEHDTTRRIKTELLIQMEAADKFDKANVFLLCATNCPWDLDKAFLRRFQKRIYTPLPSKTSRIKIMKLNCRGSTVDIGESDWETLGEKTEGYSGSDLSALTNEALFEPIRDLQTATQWKATAGGFWTPVEANESQGITAIITDFPPEKVCPRRVAMEDFLNALKFHRPTVSEEELRRFANFTTCHGQIG